MYISPRLASISALISASDRRHRASLGARPHWPLGRSSRTTPVLQRDTPIPVWGTARPGDDVTVTVAAARATARG